MNKKEITIAKVKTPWYAGSMLLKRGFKKSIPLYTKLPGLLFKYYSITAKGKLFGGIYLWDNLESAKKQFSPAWFARVKTKYKAEGKVEYYNVIKDSTFVENTFDYSKIQNKSAAILLRGLKKEFDVSACIKDSTILRVYSLKDENDFAAIVLFKTDKDAKKYVDENLLTEFELFKTPVLLNNLNN